MDYEQKRIMVAVRVRPVVERERYDAPCTQRVDDSVLALVKSEPRPGNEKEMVTDRKEFSFDFVFDDSDTQLDVYESAARDLVDAALEGHNSTIFAYGQTGSGKTFTVLGKTDTSSKDLLTSQSGIFLRVVSDLFAYREKCKNVNNVAVVLSSMEIYNEEVRDLLSKREVMKVRQRKDDIVVPGLTRVIVKDMAQVHKYFERASKARVVCKHAQNDVSSRSHAVFSLDIVQHSVALSAEDMLTMLDEKTKIEGVTCSRCTIVDLAGNERVKESGVVGHEMKQAQAINKSLFMLKLVVKNMYEGKKANFRDSQLTQLLKDSFVDAKSRVLMICNVSPVVSSYDASLLTLRFADDVKVLNVKGSVCGVDAQMEQEYLQQLRKAEELAAELRIASVKYGYVVDRAQMINVNQSLDDLVINERERAERAGKEKERLRTLEIERKAEETAKASSEETVRELDFVLEDKRKLITKELDLTKKIGETKTEKQQQTSEFNQLKGERSALQSQLEKLDAELQELRSTTGDDSWTQEVRDWKLLKAFHNKGGIFVTKMLQLRSAQLAYFNACRRLESSSKTSTEDEDDVDSCCSEDDEEDQPLFRQGIVSVLNQAEEAQRQEDCRLANFLDRDRFPLLSKFLNDGIWVFHHTGVAESLRRKLQYNGEDSLMWEDKSATSPHISESSLCCNLRDITSLLLGASGEGFQQSKLKDEYRCLSFTVATTKICVETSCPADFDALAQFLSLKTGFRLAWGTKLSLSSDATSLHSSQAALCADHHISVDVLETVRSELDQLQKEIDVEEGVAINSPRRGASNLVQSQSSNHAGAPPTLTFGEFYVAIGSKKLDVVRAQPVYEHLVAAGRIAKK